MKSPLLGRFHLVAGALHELDRANQRHRLSMINRFGWFAAGLVAILILSSSAMGQVVPPEATVEGKTMAEWVETWALWAWGAPDGVHVAEDLAHTHLGQDGPVWFLGTSGGWGNYEKSVAVPADKHVLMGVFFSLAGYTDIPRNIVAEAKALTDDFDEAFFELGEVAIPQEELLTDYRHATGKFYYELLPPNAIRLTETASGHVAFDGLWVMLEPLAPGQHTIRHGGGISPSQDIHGEVIRHLFAFEDPADFDFDGDVDSADRAVQSANWTGASMLGEGERMLFIDGDTDFDGDIDTADQTTLTQNWTGTMAGNPDDSEHAKLIYDPSTGHVTLDANDTATGKIRNFAMANAMATDWYQEGITEVARMRPENALFPFNDTGTNTDGEALQIGQSDASGHGAGPTIDLGEIFPSGLDDVDSLSEYLTLAEYASDLGIGGTLGLIVRGDGDFDADRILTTQDIDRLSDEIHAAEPRIWFDLNNDGSVNDADRDVWVHELKNTYYGDANLDGEFNSGDLITVFQAGEYEDDEVMNSTWGTGDWNGDGDFDTGDLVRAFQDGGFEKGPRAVQAVPEPCTTMLVAIAMICLSRNRRPKGRPMSRMVCPICGR